MLPRYAAGRRFWFLPTLSFLTIVISVTEGHRSVPKILGSHVQLRAAVPFNAAMPPGAPGSRDVRRIAEPYCCNQTPKSESGQAIVRGLWHLGDGFPSLSQSPRRRGRIPSARTNETRIHSLVWSLTTSAFHDTFGFQPFGFPPQPVRNDNGFDSPTVDGSGPPGYIFLVENERREDKLRSLASREVVRIQ